MGVVEDSARGHLTSGASPAGATGASGISLVPARSGIGGPMNSAGACLAATFETAPASALTSSQKRPALSSPHPKTGSRPGSPMSSALSAMISPSRSASRSGMPDLASEAAAVTKGAANDVPVFGRAPRIDAAVQTSTPGAATSMCSPRPARR
jgi:hypothetical protein